MMISERNQQIRELFSKGMTTYELGDIFEITHQRVSQILKEQVDEPLSELREKYMVRGKALEVTELGETRFKNLVKSLQIRPIHTSKGRIWYTLRDIQYLKDIAHRPKTCMVCGEYFTNRRRRVRCSDECSKEFYKHPYKYLDKDKKAA